MTCHQPVTGAVVDWSNRVSTRCLRCLMFCNSPPKVLQEAVQQVPFKLEMVEMPWPRLSFMKSSYQPVKAHQAPMHPYGHVLVPFQASHDKIYDRVMIWLCHIAMKKLCDLWNALDSGSVLPVRTGPDRTDPDRILFMNKCMSCNLEGSFPSACNFYLSV